VELMNRKSYIRHSQLRIDRRQSVACGKERLYRCCGFCRDYSGPLLLSSSTSASAEIADRARLLLTLHMPTHESPSPEKDPLQAAYLTLHKHEAVRHDPS
jgi:hypothetical protein